MCTGTLYERAARANRLYGKQAAVESALDRQLAANEIDWSPIVTERMVQIKTFVNEFLSFANVGGPEWYEFCFDCVLEKI